MADLDDVRSIASAFRNGLDAQGNFMESEDGPHLSTELEPPVEVEQINNQETLGISTRLKDLLLIGGYVSVLLQYLVQYIATVHVIGGVPVATPCIVPY